MTVQEFLQYFLQDAIPHPYHIFGWFELSSAETGNTFAVHVIYDHAL